ncbi:MAG: hypothetical protein AAGF11_26975, partial [Myxococcota bacterium]
MLQSSTSAESTQKKEVTIMQLKVNSIIKHAIALEKDKQWSNATDRFRAALETEYNTLFEEATGSKTPTTLSTEILRQTLEAIHDPKSHKTNAPISLIQISSKDTFKNLHNTLKELFGEDINDNCITAAAFTAASSTGKPQKFWTIIFHSCKHKEYNYTTSSDKNVNIKVNHIDPDPKQSVFIMRTIDESKQSDAIKVENINYQRIAYIWAHLAECSSYATMKLYKISKVLLTGRSSAMYRHAYRFQVALAIEPNYCWALAHLGEFCRNIANGWGQALGTRIQHYVMALDYLVTSQDKKAIKHRLGKNGKMKKPSSVCSNPWLLAHIGATIVNARVFVHISKKTEPKDDILSQLIDQLFHQLTDNAKRSTIALLEESRDCLVKAQALKGFYYPWAQNYHGDALLLLSILIKKSHTARVSCLSTTQLLDSFFLKQRMIEQTIEPGELFRNPNLDISVFYFAKGYYTLAWQHAWIGIHYSFKFDFVSSVQTLIGCKIIALSSHKMLRKTKVKRLKLLRHGGFLQDNIDVTARIKGTFHLPTEPFTAYPMLLDFISRVIVRVGHPAIEPLLHHNVKWSEKIHVSMHATIYIFLTFLFLVMKIIKRKDDELTKCSKLATDLLNFIKTIIKKFEEDTANNDAIENIKKILENIETELNNKNASWSEEHYSELLQFAEQN